MTDPDRPHLPYEIGDRVRYRYLAQDPAADGADPTQITVLGVIIDYRHVAVDQYSPARMEALIPGYGWVDPYYCDPAPHRWWHRFTGRRQPV